MARSKKSNDLKKMAESFPFLPVQAMDVSDFLILTLRPNLLYSMNLSMKDPAKPEPKILPIFPLWSPSEERTPEML